MDYCSCLVFNSLKKLLENLNRRKILLPFLIQVNIEGNIGCGKSTLIDYISKIRPDYEVQRELLDKFTNYYGVNMLKEYYEDQRKNGFEFQVFNVFFNAFPLCYFCFC